MVGTLEVTTVTGEWWQNDIDGLGTLVENYSQTLIKIGFSELKSVWSYLHEIPISDSLIEIFIVSYNLPRAL